MGGFTISYTSVANVFCAIWPVSATELIQAQATTMVMTHRIRIRYRAILKPSWRVSWAGRYFAIVSIVDPNMAHRWLDILVKEAG